MAMRENDPTFEVMVEVKAKTDKALMVMPAGNNQKGSGVSVWIPFSHVSVHSEIGRESKIGDSGSLEVSEWIAKQKEWV